ncbi:uncharacterized protein OCT59_028533 [Rhizophagus irregularis]|uniref:Uncharacterized protein n=1 Tax=Rhizophagus irregularis (strain DAOM 181602 / DAOM 197198 / MUCL 43194) TaxID=747089 RepID=U9TMI2_RHIID|nr:hypothetical protein GLOIN_2v1772865 [Rhizophagus irregularis DAOM 181602=DAOM 197198]POG73106.1 hypothetical protein GLOIN_2v1772865 [Rhizophagus irregularis DAOM 181602=DAOM 197198]UZO08275.1 hypothetical protein OCT59_028533 [Rhizophagus irregularis]|eukprot:XP_025179972.1 hypothetical protein GLOIN_2v1772865 [Rhizophagus irregularis DAOM 181602=DAOM 197198]
MVNNTSLTPIKQQIIDGDIDWTFTKEWLNHNPTDAPCSAKLSKRQGARLKKCNFIYPTIDIQQQHVNEKDHALEETINSSRLFDVNFVGSLPTDHPCYLLIHHLVSSDLTLIFYNYITDKKSRFSIFIKFMNIIMEKIDLSIWNCRNAHVKEWERNLSITKVKKKFYRRRYHSNDNSSPPDNIQSDSTLRRTYTHRQIPTIPYSRTGEFYNNEVHIRWTSSNFLHSRPWTTHRDNFWFDNIDLFSSFNYNIIGNYINTR